MEERNSQLDSIYGKECDKYQETSESPFTLATAVENKREKKEKAENLKETIHELELTLKEFEKNTTILKRQMDETEAFGRLEIQNVKVTLHETELTLQKQQKMTNQLKRLVRKMKANATEERADTGGFSWSVTGPALLFCPALLLLCWLSHWPPAAKLCARLAPSDCRATKVHQLGATQQ